MRTSRWVLATYALLILLGIAAALPSLLPASGRAHLPSWLESRQVTLGLDLRGGSHLVLEVDQDALKHARLQSVRDDAEAALEAAGIAARSAVEGDRLIISPAEASDVARAAAVVRPLIPQVGASAFAPGASEFALTEEAGALSLATTEDGLAARTAYAVDQSLEVIRGRIDQVGVAEPTIQRVGGDRILVQLPGLQDPSRLRALLGSTAQMSFHLLAQADANGRPPLGATALPAADGTGSYVVMDRVAVSGERLSDAHGNFDQRTGEPIVTFRFDTRGALEFAEITRANVGQPFAIVLDGKVLSAPVIREPITGGSGQISGGFTIEEATDLAAMLRAGALPVPLTVIEERSVGPDLGSDAVETGIAAGLLGFALVAAFMIALYGRWGLVANLALALNVTLTFGALGLLGGTLTLPGLAGVILGLGIAVDANILINERIKEETRKGASAMKALDLGFRRAYASIVDANVTTLLATGLLFLFGAGPVRGFAVTMMLGIVISMFTAVAVVRVIMREHVLRRRPKQLRIEPLLHLGRAPQPISFMKARFLGIGLSLVLSAASIGLFLSPGLAYGIDFKGGIQLEVSAPVPLDLAAMRSTMNGLGLGEATLQTIGEDAVLLRVERQPGGEAAQTAAVETIKAAVRAVAPEATIDRSEVVGPKVSGELARSGLIAVGLAMLGMLGYIWWRFEWHFAVGAIATLLLDATKTIGFFALTGLDFNLTAVAALLTIIGYSVNDKVVVYDRMRENMRLHKAMPLRGIIDMSINQVLARCVFTSATTALAMLPLAIWGGPAVASFAIPMLFGVVIATSSSIFIAAPILLFLGDWRGRRRATGAASDTEVAVDVRDRKAYSATAPHARAGG
jgi:SecD/SecF fusion protein